MSLTPMMKQYQDAKEKHPGTVLLFRMGDFYELFGEDAVAISRELQLTLTSRDKQLPMAGFPHHALETHLRKLIERGHRVAICEQVEDPAQAKGIVKREVVRVVTPGTLMEESLLDPKRANHLAAVVPAREKAGLAWMDLSTGSFHARDLLPEQLVEELIRLEVTECLWPNDLAAELLNPLRQPDSGMTLTFRPPWQFDKHSTLEALHRHFGITTLEGFGLEDDQVCVQAAGALLLYLQDMLKSQVTHVTRLEPYRADSVLGMDHVTRRSLELVRTLREGRREGSLLDAIDRTSTSMGARRLHDWLLSPLAQLEHIQARLDAETELQKHHALRRNLREQFKQFPDLPRLTTKASTGRATPRDLASIGNVLAALPVLLEVLGQVMAPLLVNVRNAIKPCQELREQLKQAIDDAPPLSPREGGFIRRGYHARLDHLRDLTRGGKEWIARYQAQEIARTGIHSLKVGFNSVFGYYLEITNAHAAKIPADYQRKQTLKNCERYITPELKTHEEEVLRAEEESTALEYEIFVQLRQQVVEQASALLSTAEALATLDVLVSLAELADGNEWVKPDLVTETVCEIIQGRHPVLERSMPTGTFVPNDTRLNDEGGSVWLITGPNMAGKSTYIRQVALIQILAQMGSYVPAHTARLGVADRLFARVGAGDDLSRGQSTFMVEMAETANILNNATSRSLVILDELGRGTSTYDGLSLAWAIVEHLHHDIGCRTLFATHYHELTKLAELLPGVRNWNAAVHEEMGRITFIHRIAPGPAERSFGIHVAQLAGLPGKVLERARAVLEELENSPASIPAQAMEAVKRKKRKVLEEQPGLFDQGTR
ncbi:MAG TPA: DNA mismatch repair protein MutS [Gemmatales bacterium]|nr:DNA mismatch repair protein MutS [Gemmatales bacterium]